jgi:hypothetical protein
MLLPDKTPAAVSPVMIDFIIGSLSAFLGLLFSSSGGELAAVIRSPFPREPALRLTLSISLLALLTASLLTRDGIFSGAALLSRWQILLILILFTWFGVWLGHRSDSSSTTGLIWLLGYGVFLLLYPFLIGHRLDFHSEILRPVSMVAVSMVAGYYTGRFGFGAEAIYISSLIPFHDLSFASARTITWATTTLGLFLSLVLASRHRPPGEGVAVARRLPATSAIIGALLATWLLPKPVWPWASIAMGSLITFCGLVSSRASVAARHVMK